MAIHVCKIFILSGLLLLGTAKTALAQNCTTIPEAIQRLYEPRLGTYTLWDIVDGVEDMAQKANDFIMLNEAQVILAGAQESKDLLRPLIKKVDRKGRTMWRWNDKNKEGRSRPIEILELVEQKGGFIALGQIYRQKKPHAIWVGRFSNEGQKLGETILSEPSRDLIYGGFTAATNGKGWLLATTEYRITKEDNLSQPGYTRFIRLNSQFQRLSKRSFMPGPMNAVHAIETFQSATGEPFFIVAGEMGDGAGRSAGLVMRLDATANIAWQRLYPRGGGLRFQAITQSPDGNILVTGLARPIDPDARDAAVAMKLESANGAEIWQRYFTRDDLAYEGLDVVATADGRTHVMLKGTGDPDAKIQDHARIITLSPRGDVIDEISYTAGVGASPVSLRRGVNDLLTLSGQVLAEDPDPADPENKVVLRKKSWFVVGEPFGEIEDPCKIEERPF